MLNNLKRLRATCVGPGSKGEVRQRSALTPPYSKWLMCKAHMCVWRLLFVPTECSKSAIFYRKWKVTTVSTQRMWLCQLMDPGKNSKIQNVSQVAMNIVCIEDVSQYDTLHTAASLRVTNLLPEDSSPLGCDAVLQGEWFLKL